MTKTAKPTKPSFWERIKAMVAPGASRSEAAREEAAAPTPSQTPTPAPAPAPAEKTPEPEPVEVPTKAAPVETPAAAQDDPRTKAELYEEAKKRDIPGRSSMTKEELLKALAEH